MCLDSPLYVFQKDGLNNVNPWLSVVEELAPEVLILVCDHVCDSGECVFGIVHHSVCFFFLFFFKFGVNIPLQVLADMKPSNGVWLTHLN